VKLAILSGDISDRFSAGFIGCSLFMKLKTIHKCARFLQKRLSFKDFRLVNYFKTILSRLCFPFFLYCFAYFLIR
jgi:hypothetical protein